MNMISVLSSPLLAAADQPGGPTSMQRTLVNFVPLAVIILVMYMLWIRPEQKRAKEHRETVQRLKAGDRVVTTAGLHGTVAAVNDKTIKLEVADGVRLELDRGAIARVVPATEGK